MAPQNDEANLARIRDNQRRSRARRKEYQQELEQRVRAFEELGVEASTEVQHAARRVAEENKKLRALLQHSGVSHSSIEAYLRTGDASATATSSTATGDSVQSLEHLMVPRFPLQYTALPMMSGNLSAANSAGPSSPMGGGGGGGDASDSVGYYGQDTISGGGGAASSATSSPPLGTASGVHGRGGSSARGSGSSHGRSSQGHGHGHSHGHRSSGEKGKTTTTTTTTMTTTNDYATAGNYLAPGYGLPTTFYGLDGTSAEDLPYTTADATFFDYSSNAAGSGMMGVSQAPGSNPYYGNVQGLVSTGASTGTFVRTCPACMSGMGCAAHGGFFEE
ncbi:hypothetical protein SBRCBS47491_001267 [Sporothrix bragantina]|uniref:BZIP domain-containing protein n=1 Tax=Sporothrix bragantina TaxID=671064 RepID=A0ABP0AX61_9PEZI